MGGFQVARPTVNPIEQPDVLQNYGRIQQLAGMKQQQQQAAQMAPLQLQQAQQQVQGGAIDLQQKQQEMQDQQAFRSATQDPALQGKTIGTIADVLASKGAISPGAYQAAKKADIDQRKELQAMDGAKLDNAVKATAANKQLFESVMSMPDDQLAQNWAGIVQQYNAIPGNEKRPLNPQQPLTKEQIAQQGPVLAIHQAYIDDELSRRQKETAAKTAQIDLQKKQEDMSYGPTGAAADGKFSFLQKKLALGQELSADDKAWMEGYKKQKLLVPQNRISINGSTGDNDIKDTAQMIAAGEAPPVLTEYSFRDRTKLAGELKRMGYNLAGAEQDWKATQKFLQTANGSQQLRLRQAITALPDLSDKIEGLYNEWSKLAPTSGFKTINKASLSAMKNLPGRPGAVAQALEAQIADAVSDLAVVYMGGNSPTDHGLDLAKKNLSADWNDETFKEGLKQLKLNAQIRKNSLAVGPVGVSGNSPYPQQIGGGNSGGNNDPLGIR